MNYDDAIHKVLRKTRLNMSMFSGEAAPVVTVNGSYAARAESFYDRNHWTLSFLTGTVLHGFHATGELEFLRYVYGFADMYRHKAYDLSEDTMHDLGFLYSLYSAALYQTTGDPGARRTALKAADELAKRFLPLSGMIQAWDRMDELEKKDGATMIADTMMNLPLLLWAWKETGNLYYKQVAMSHADTTAKYMVRSDGSIYHAYEFRTEDGAPAGPRNYCGFGLESAWARGTAWAIYGFVLAYRYTGHAAKLDTALRLIAFYLSQLPDDGVPVWDFRLAADRPRIKDVSAAAIAACALLELSDMDAAKYGGYRKQAERMIESLSSPFHLTDNEEIESSLVNFPDGTYSPEQLAQYDRDSGGIGETGTVFGDYFYMEALMKLSGKSTFHW
ncbi:glycoside hydrolase family 88 protein [Paenibacillus sp. GCM10027626]|uniref:glycoside hydrolase family 88 protein n=1 Tax=Paenibacillus sp. GCM10027626 TaxID=3273411 RepID=UPI00362D384D